MCFEVDEEEEGSGWICVIFADNTNETRRLAIEKNLQSELKDEASCIRWTLEGNLEISVQQSQGNGSFNRMCILGQLDTLR